MKLTKAQEKAISTIRGQLVIPSGPGSGKTEVIIRRIEYMINAGIPAHNICAITFGKYAASVIKERLTERVGEDKLKGIYIGTIHAFCLFAIRTVRDEQKIDVADSPVELLALSYKKYKEFGYSEKEATSMATKLSVEYKDVMQHLQENEKFGDYDIDKKAEKVSEKIAEIGIITFGLMLSNFHSLMLLDDDFREAIQNRFTYILVDEYQDVSNIQAMLIDKIAEKSKNICVVGDVDQAIYEFRGATPKYMLNFKNKYPEAVLVSNNVTHRFGKLIADAVNMLISHNKQRYPYKVTPANPQKEGRIELRSYQTLSDLYQHVASDVAIRYTKDKNCSIAVISRKNEPLAKLCKELDMLKIPYTTKYEKVSKILEIVMGLRLRSILVNKPGSLDPEVIARSVITKFCRGIGKVYANSIISIIKNNNVNLFDYIKGSVNSRTIDTQLKNMLNEEAYKNFNKLRTEARKLGRCISIEDMESLYNYIENIIKVDNQKTNYKMVSLKEFISGLVAHGQEIVTEDANPSGIFLSSYHKAKGLEFDTVFLLDGRVRDKLLPHQLEEERRLIYVAITRARKEVIYTWPRTTYVRKKYGKSGYVGSPLPKFVTELMETGLCTENHVPLICDDHLLKTLNKLSELRKDHTNVLAMQNM